MKNYSSQEIQDISSEFRAIARRLSRTDYSQCDVNLKRFISYIQSNELINEFIVKNNIHKYDIIQIIEDRDWLDPFETSPIFEEEISLAFQMLTYSIDNFDGNFTRLYGTYHYTSSKSTANDEMRKFIEHIIDPFIDHIGDYLRKCYDNAIRDEEKNKSIQTPSFTATNSTVVISSNVGGDILTESVKTDSQELITAIKAALEKEKISTMAEIKEIIEQVETEIKENKKPKKGMLTALKVLCSGASTIIPLITALIELLA